MELQIQKIKNSFQTKEKFLSNLRKYDQNKKYGRQILKGKIELQKNIKYIRIHMNCLCSKNCCNTSNNINE